MVTLCMVLFSALGASLLVILSKIKKKQNGWVDSDTEFGFQIGSICSFFIAFCFFCSVCYNSVVLMDSLSLDQKISIYQEENAEIEKETADLVTNYMKYEKETFAKTASKSSITLVSLYPELKSDELVANQIKIYYKNNQEIKDLRAEKADLAPVKFALFFGGF